MTLLIQTRDVLHDLARFVLAHDLEGTTELITLRPTPGGFGQPERLVDGLQRRLRIDGTMLVVQRGETEQWLPITTLAAAAADAAVTLRADAPQPDLPLQIDAAEASSLAQFFALTDLALAELRRRHRDDQPTIAQLFPHHFDLAITLRQVNIGGSPGDADHDVPYLYVGPWNPVANEAQKEAWNETWGASMTWTDATTLDDALGFFERNFGIAVASAGTPS
ncbi:MAG: hypothetical protein JWN99_955 [Ilumatobacteraceae bacterium]|nr:hypothetical protein [Ilumatobacteraceae bacterium]